MGTISSNTKHPLGPLHEFEVANDRTKGISQYGWKDMTADLAGRGQGATAPTWAEFRNGMFAYRFDKADELWIIFHPNHDVIPGELFYPHVHWSTNSTNNSGTVVWTMDVSIAEGFDTDAFPAPTTFDLTYTFTENKQYQHLISEASDGQALVMPDVDSLIMMRLERKNDAADTFLGNVFGLTLDIHYRAGKWATIGKRPDFNTPD